MKKSFVGFTATVISMLFISNAYAGASVCASSEKTLKDNRTDVEYFTYFDDTNTGFQAENIVRKNYKNKFTLAPRCQNSRDLINGYFVVINNTRERYSNSDRISTYASGYGKTIAEAEKDAVDRLGMIDWDWTEKKGYTVDYVQDF